MHELSAGEAQSAGITHKDRCNSQERSPERRKGRIVFVTGVDDIDKLVSSGVGRRIEDQITQYAHVHEIAESTIVRGVLFKITADIIGASCICV